MLTVQAQVQQVWAGPEICIANELPGTEGAGPWAVRWQNTASGTTLGSQVLENMGSVLSFQLCACIYTPSLKLAKEKQDTKIEIC